MAFVNVIDNSSTTVSASTPGITVDLREHTTYRLRNVGVPVRFKVCVYSSAGADTGAVKLLDSNGVALITCLVNGAATTDAEGDWYWADGYVPDALAKYDVHYGGNTTGSLTVFSTSLYEIDWTTDPRLGVLSASIGEFTLVADGHSSLQGELSQSIGEVTLSAAGNSTLSGDLSQSIGEISLSATGINEDNGVLSQSIGTISLSATGTVAAR